MKIDCKQISQVYVFADNIYGKQYGGGCIIYTEGKPIEIHFESKKELEAIKQLIQGLLDVYDKMEGKYGE